MSDTDTALRGTWRAALADDPGVADLFEALAWGDRFHLHLVSCRSSAVVAELVSLITARVTPRREGQLRVLHANPAAGRPSPLSPLTREDLAREVLDVLRAGSPGDVVLVIDATTSLALDDDVWTWCFQRLNEQRNVIMRDFHGEVVLCVPPRLERLLARHAPDVWSVRGVSVTLGEGLEVVEGISSIQGIANALVAGASILSRAEVDAFVEEVAAARLRVASRPGDFTARFTLASRLLRLAGYEAGAAQIADALTHAEEALDGFRALFEEAPTHHDVAAMALAATLMLAGRALALGRIDRVRETHAEATRYLESLRSAHALDAGRLDIAASLHVQRARAELLAGDVGATLAFLAEARALLSALTPDRQAELGYSIAQLEHQSHLLEGRVDVARDAADRMLDAAQRWAARGTIPARQVLAWTLLARARFRLQTGSPAEALKDIDAALPVLDGLLEAFPDAAEIRYLRARALGDRGMCLVQCARGMEALPLLEEAIAKLEGLLAQQPDRLEYLDAVGGWTQAAWGAAPHGPHASGLMARGREVDARLLALAPRNATFRMRAALRPVLAELVACVDGDANARDALAHDLPALERVAAEARHPGLNDVIEQARALLAKAR